MKVIYSSTNNFSMRKKAIDAKDIEIINILQQDATLTNKDLAKKIGLGESSTLNRVTHLFNKKVFTGYSALIDYTFFGYKIETVGIITILADNMPLLIEESTHIKNIVSPCVLTPNETSTGKTSTLGFHIITRSEEELRNILLELKSIPDVIEFKFYGVEKIPNRAILYLDEEDVM